MIEMKKLKLKHATLCQILLYLPVILCVLIPILLFVICENDVICGALLVIGCVLSLVYLIILFPALLGSDIIFSNIRNWKKDRLYFTADCNNDKFDKVIALINKRIKKFGKSCEIDNRLLVVPKSFQYKKAFSIYEAYSSIEKILLVYKIDYLDEANYKKIQASSNLALLQLQDNSNIKSKKNQTEKSSVCRAVAMIIFADRVNVNIPKLVRKLPNFDNTAIIPCVVDIYAKRFYFDAMKEIYILGAQEKPSKNFAIDLLVKVVFNGRLPLKGNDNLDYSRIKKDLIDKTFFEYIKDFYSEYKKENQVSKKIVKSMRDGELLHKDEIVYLKRGDRVAVFPIVLDNESKLIEILVSGYWDYPKCNKISKTTLKSLKQQIEAYFYEKGIKAIFVDDR